MEIIKDIIIGLVSGGISSWLVSVSLKRYWDNKDHKKQFAADKQSYSRYIQTIKTELLLAFKINDYEFLVRAIEDEPIRESFNYLSAESKKNAKEIAECLNQLKKDALSSKLSEEKYKSISGKLYQYSVWALKFTEEKQKWHV